MPPSYPLDDVTSLLSVKVRPRLNKGLNHCLSIRTPSDPHPRVGHAGGHDKQAQQRSRWRRRSPAARASPRARTAGTAGSIFTRTSADVSVPRPRTYDDRTAGSSLITLITYFSSGFALVVGGLFNRRN